MGPTRLATIALAALALGCGSKAGDEQSPEATSTQASAVEDEHHHAHRHLALGDSVPFGSNPLVDPNDTDDFVGYPEVVARRTDQVLTNASCPGETSGSLLDTSQPDNGCQAWRAAHPLHVRYSGSQIAFAVDFLETHRTELVTLFVGPNDLFLLQHECALDPATALQCELSGLPGVVARYGENVAAIFGDIARTGFRGQVVAVTAYSLDYRSALDTQAAAAINSVLAQLTAEFGFTLADGFAAFKRVAARAGGDTCGAGLLIRLADDTCDVHPSRRGRDLLAKTVIDVLDCSVLE
jgi:hypothetical protein